VIHRSALSRQNISLVITTSTGDPTALPLAMAFPAPGTDPVDADWQSGTWSTTPGPLPGDYIGQCLVGPGGTIALAVGVYDVWFKVTGNPEVPVGKATQLTVS
jgi:hypothetical protein